MALFFLALVIAGSVPDSVVRSAVTWADAHFEGEKGSMPLGNGNLAANVWVEEASGDLLFYLAGSDVFDQNSQPVKISRVRLRFSPPLWSAGVRSFSQNLDVASGTIWIRTASGGREYSVAIWVDANSPAIRVQARVNASTFGLTAQLEIYRTQVQKTALGRGFCNQYNDIPDILVPPDTNASASVTWYHRNDYAVANPSGSSYYEWALRQAGLAPDAFPDPYVNLTFGGVRRSAGGDPLHQLNDSSLHGDGLRSTDLVASIHVSQAPTARAWLEAARAADAATLPSAAARAAHEKFWAQFWRRSFINLPNPANDSAQAIVERQAVWARFLDAADGRNSRAPIKFNGQAFTVDEGKGPDYRDWGACYWFQNTRQPYYNALAAGDIDIFQPLLAFYNASIPLVRARVAEQYARVSPPVSGGYWPETMTAFGTYNEGDWGCSTPPSGATDAGDSTNTFIRYHFTGTLELALFAIDGYTATLDEHTFEHVGLPIIETALEFFRTRFPKRDGAGKMDMWPAQGLETHQVCVRGRALVSSDQCRMKCPRHRPSPSPCKLTLKP